MKNTLKVLALVVAAASPGLAFAEILGVPVPTVLHADSAFGMFVLLVGALIVLHDYSSELRPLSVDGKNGFSTHQARRSRAYGIRRGADVARLTS